MTKVIQISHKKSQFILEDNEHQEIVNLINITSKDTIHIKIRSNYEYDNLIFNNDAILHIKQDPTDVSNNYECGDRNNININCCLVRRWSGIITHYIIRELHISNNYRRNFINHITKKQARQIEINLCDPPKQILDLNWNRRTTYMVLERSEVDNALSWFSTLGGAFSALGDYFPSAAEMAGKISLRQFQLALRIGDPNIQARCRLFMSLSLIQQGRLKTARKIVSNEYKLANNSIVKDERLVKMCLGIWAKLMYEWKKKKSIKN